MNRLTKELLKRIKRIFEQDPSCTLRVAAIYRDEDGRASKVNETVTIRDVTHIERKVASGGYEIKEVIKL